MYQIKLAIHINLSNITGKYAKFSMQTMCKRRHHVISFPACNDTVDVYQIVRYQIYFGMVHVDI